MFKALACFGNKTTKGYISSATSTWFEGDKRVAKFGDLAWCNECKGNFPINGTADGWGEDKPFVIHGDRVMCRCTDHVVCAESTQFTTDIASRFANATPAVVPHLRSSPSVRSFVPVPVFAKSCLRGEGCTDAGLAPEPVDNFGKMSFYQVSTYSPVTAQEPEQHAQAAKRKPAAEAATVAVGRTATTAGSDTLNMRYVGGSIMSEGRWLAAPNPLTIALMGLFYSPGLNKGEQDFIDRMRLEQAAEKRGKVPTRVRFRWIHDESTDQMQVEGYHVSPEGGRDMVPVRQMTLNNTTGNYEFWEDGAKQPTILWTPSDPGFKAPTDTANDEKPFEIPKITVLPVPNKIGSDIESLPMPEERDFRDYILILPIQDIPPIYVYLSKPPTKFLEVELYSDFQGRPREGMHADHMPSAAAVKKYFKNIYPDADTEELTEMAKDVAALIIPADVHRKLSETYGGRNSPEMIIQDSKDLQTAVDRNFNAIKPALKEYGATEEELETARTKIHKLNGQQGLY